jgi:L-amino acid N-acyltransferase YncA
MVLPLGKIGPEAFLADPWRDRPPTPQQFVEARTIPLSLAAGDGPPPSRGTAYLRKQLADPLFLHVGAIAEDSTLVGYAAGQILKGEDFTHVLLQEVLLHPCHDSRMTHVALLGAFVRLARSLGATEVRVRIEHPALAALYRQAGFTSRYRVMRLRARNRKG